MCTKTSLSVIEFRWKTKKFFNVTFNERSSVRSRWIQPKWYVVLMNVFKKQFFFFIRIQFKVEKIQKIRLNCKKMFRSKTGWLFTLSILWIEFNFFTAWLMKIAPKILALRWVEAKNMNICGKMVSNIRYFLRTKKNNNYKRNSGWMGTRNLIFG